MSKGAPSPRLPFTVAVNLVLVGESGHGKNEQIRRIWAAEEDGERPFRRCLFLASEASAKVASAVIINDPCTVYRHINTPEDLISALALLDEGVNGEPFQLVAFDGWSHLQERTKADERSHGGKDAKDNRVMAAAASPRMRSAAAEWTSAMGAHPGVLFVSTCHTAEEWKQRPGSKDIKERIRVGYKMDLSDAVKIFICREGNAIVFLTRVLRDVSEWIVGDDDDEINTNIAALREARAEGHFAPRFLAFTEPVKFQGDSFDFIKWQDGLLPEQARPVIPNPNLGELLLASPLRKR